MTKNTVKPPRRIDLLVRDLLDEPTKLKTGYAERHRRYREKHYKEDKND